MTIRPIQGAHVTIHLIHGLPTPVLVYPTSQGFTQVADMRDPCETEGEAHDSAKKWAEELHVEYVRIE